MITFLKFVYTCTLISFVIQHHRNCNSIVVLMWDSILFANGPKAVEIIQVGQFGTTENSNSAEKKQKRNMARKQPDKTLVEFWMLLTSFIPIDLPDLTVSGFP